MIQTMERGSDIDGDVPEEPKQQCMRTCSGSLKLIRAKPGEDTAGYNLGFAVGNKVLEAPAT